MFSAATKPTNFRSGTLQIVPSHTSFLMNTTYIFYRYTNSNTGATNTAIYKLKLSVTGTGASDLTKELVYVGAIDGQIETVAAFELNGFIFTK